MSDVGGERAPLHVRIIAHRHQEDLLQRAVSHQGPVLLQWLCGSGRKGMPKAGLVSLRECSRLTGLSPTYLSHCRSGTVSLSFGAYVRLSELWNKLQREQQKQTEKKAATE